MKVKKYRAADRGAALKQIRAELGPQAVIVHEQRVRQGAFGLFGKTEIEVLAAIEEHNIPLPGQVPPPGRSTFAPRSTPIARPAASAPPEVQATISPAARRAAAATSTAPPAPTGVGSSPEDDGASRLAALIDQLPKNGAAISPQMAASLADMITRVVDSERAPGDAAPPGRAGGDVSAAADTASAAPLVASPLYPGSGGDGVNLASDAVHEGTHAARPEPGPAMRLPAVTPTPDGSGVLRDMQHTLVELRSAVDRLTRQSQDAQLSHETPVLRAIYQELMAQEVEPTLASELATQLSEEIGPDHLPDAHLVRGRLHELLLDRLPVATLPAGRDGPCVVALVGPTGVGKTTTLAKLAAHLAFERSKRTCLVTTDTFRIAAARQLGTYAEIMSLPLDVVYTPAELRRAVYSHGDADYVLIDTPGCAQRNDTQLQELATFLAAVPEATVLLAIAAPTKLRDLVEIQQGFSTAPLSGLVLTKLDETSAYGPVLSVVSRGDLPVFFTTSGQNVPSDIEEADSEKLATLLSGIDRSAFATATAAAAGAAGGGELPATDDESNRVVDGARS